MDEDQTRSRIREEIRIRKEEEAKENARELGRGCIGVLILVGCVVGFVWWVTSGVPEKEATKEARRKAIKESAQRLTAQTDATFNRLAKSADNPCRDHGLYFFRSLGTWYMTCGEGCAGVPADSLYPPAVLKLLDEYSVRKRMTMLNLRRLTRQC